MILTIGLAAIGNAYRISQPSVKIILRSCSGSFWPVSSAKSRRILSATQNRHKVCSKNATASPVSFRQACEFLRSGFGWAGLARDSSGEGGRICGRCRGERSAVVPGHEPLGLAKHASTDSRQRPRLDLSGLYRPGSVEEVERSSVRYSICPYPGQCGFCLHLWPIGTDHCCRGRPRGKSFLPREACLGTPDQWSTDCRIVPMALGLGRVTSLLLSRSGSAANPGGFIG